MGDVSEMENFEAEMSEHFGDDFVKTLKKMTESNWATGKPSVEYALCFAQVQGANRTCIIVSCCL